MSEVALRLTVNGEERQVTGSAGRRLLDVLRDDLGLGGPREGCGIGICGTCTVLVDGQPASGCLLLAEQAVDREVVTVEGLATGGQLHKLQQAFIDHHAFQCAYCTPGFLLTTVALLAEVPEPTDDEIREYLAGNLCRCGSYRAILEAVRSLAGRPATT